MYSCMTLKAGIECWLQQDAHNPAWPVLHQETTACDLIHLNLGGVFDQFDGGTNPWPRLTFSSYYVSTS